MGVNFNGFTDVKQLRFKGKELSCKGISLEPIWKPRVMVEFLSKMKSVHLKKFAKGKKYYIWLKQLENYSKKKTFQDNHWTLSVIAHTAVAALIAICYINLLLGSSAIKKGIRHI